jgi:cholesterol transport system auxiliary component
MKRLAAVACLFAFAACTGSLFKDKAVPPTVYLMSAESAPAAPAAAAAVAQIPADLAILRPRVRTGLESDRVAVLYPDRRLDFFADARWSGPLDQVIHDMAVQVFLTHTNLRNVSAESTVFTHAYWLEIEVLDFQAEYAAGGGAPTIHVHLLGRLGGAGDRRVMARFEASSRQPAADNRLTAIVAAYEQAANAALGELAGDAAAAIGANLERR